MSSLPGVTIAIPVLNEEQRIQACLATVAAQSYPNVVEILVVDGGSMDRTREIVSEVAKVRVIHNPARIQSVALNLALAEAKGEIFVRIDGHTRIAHDYVARCVEALVSTGAAMVGGAIDPDLSSLDSGATGQAVALAMRSPFGVGTARFHRPDAIGSWVDTVYLGAFWTAFGRTIGGYDETLVTNEDAELAWRMQSNGGVWFDPSIRSSYEPRRALRPLARQFFRYGRGRAITVARHPGSLSLRQLAVPTLLLGLLGPWRRPIAAAYAVGLALSAANATPRQWKTAALMPAALVTMHLTWGTGFLTGLPVAVIRRLPRGERRHG
jgi:succinoglycan biosynthesis protein ExoA